ncbi:unnamed protein product [Blepharisma stoltei]|uniref:Uncharacterized protein n=1 Tax=Blepharisma stoltei TaxID=1481888 RepID=A0AAU9IUZ0_9CILI|nr:unnamed protein product [Blepharisma stoltei]
MDEERYLKDEEELGYLISRIRDLYNLYKDFKFRYKEFTQFSEKAPEHIFLKDPDIQRKFRDEFIEKLSEIPSPPPIPLYPDTLLSEFLSLKSGPRADNFIKILSEFYYNQSTYIKHYKLKFLLNWAHLSQFVRVDHLNQHVNQRIVKLTDLLKLYNKRYSLLTSEDEAAITEAIESPSIFDSYIRDYINIKSNLLNTHKSIDRFLQRLKWLSVSHRSEIWKRSNEILYELKQRSIERMKLITGREDIGEYKLVVNLMTNINLRNLRKQREIMKRAKAIHSTFAEEHLNLNEQLLNSHVDEIDGPPVFILSKKQLAKILYSIQKEFALISNIEEDNGSSLFYQISNLFPIIFQNQSKRLDWIPAEKFEKDQLDINRLSNVNASKAFRSVRRNSLYVPISYQTLGNRPVRTIYIKNADWPKNSRITPAIPAWQKKQSAQLKSFLKIDNLLSSSFLILEVQDQSVVTKIVEEFSHTYVDRASKRGVLLSELGLSNEDLLKRYFASLINDANIDISSTQEPEEPLDLPIHNIKSLFLLRLLKSRFQKQSILNILNAMKSIERRIFFDMQDLMQGQNTKLIENVNKYVEEENITHYWPDKCAELYGRKNNIETLEGEIYVQDEFGYNILYKEAVDDFNELLEELKKLGSFYIDKFELWSEEQGECFPVIDRDLMLGEMLDEELKFQEEKLKLIFLYNELYDHAIDAGMQGTIAKQILNLIAMRPRYFLNGSYFTQSYWAHINSLQQHFQTINIILENSRSALHVPEVFESSGNAREIEIFEEISWIHKAWPLLQQCIDELSLIHQIETPLFSSALEQAVWEFSQHDWRYSQFSGRGHFPEEILIDRGELVTSIISELEREVKVKNWRMLPKLSLLADGRKGPVDSNIPSLQQLYANSLEIWKFRSVLEKTLEERAILEEIYIAQFKKMGKEITEAPPANWDVGFYLTSRVDEGPGSRIDFSLSAFEIDPSLRSNLHFGNVHAIKTLFLTCGLEEIRTVALYEIMNKHLLTIAIQTNQAAIEDSEKQICDIELARDLAYVPKLSKVKWNNMFGRKGEGLIPDKIEREVKRLQIKMLSEASMFGFDIKHKKLNHRENLENNYKRIAEKYKTIFEEENLHLVLRYTRCLCVQAYCNEVLREAYHDSIKLQVIKVLSEYCLLLKLVPEDLYNAFVEENPKPNQLIDEEGKIVNILYIPTIEDILALPSFTNNEKSSWADWDPYLIAETPEIYHKKLKNLLLKNSISHDFNYGSLKISNDWHFNSSVKNYLELLITMSRIFGILLFSNSMELPGKDITNMVDLLLYKNKYWKIIQENEETDPRALAVFRMLKESSPQLVLYNIFKKIIDFLKGMQSEMQTLNKIDQCKYLIFEVKRIFQCMAISIFECWNWCLENHNESDGKEVLENICENFRLTRNNFIHGLKNSINAKSSESFLINLGENLVFSDNQNYLSLGLVASSSVLKLSSTFVDCSIECRNYFFKKFIMIEKDSRKMIFNKNKSDTESVATLEEELEAWKLKLSWLSYKFEIDIPSSSQDYLSLIKEYYDTIKTKASFLIQKQKSPENLFLKLFFQISLCKESINLLQSQLISLIDTTGLDMGITGKSEFACNFDKNTHIKDLRPGDIHNFINTIRNRGTAIEAPTSGKSFTFALSDLNYLTKMLASRIIKYAETEVRIKEEANQIKSQLFDFQLKALSKEEKSVKKSLELFKSNFEGLCNSNISTRGNKLIYTLDSAFRELNEIKSNMKHLYKQTDEFIYKDFKEELQEKGRKIHDLKENHRDYYNEMAQTLKTNLTDKKEEALLEVKSGTSEYKAFELQKFILDDKNDTENKEKTELSRLQDNIIKIRIMNKWILHRIKERKEKQINELKETLQSNQYLWEQINESERREALLKQELSLTQQNLATGEKLADYLQGQIEDMNNQRLRLQQFKTTKGRRIIELEAKVKKQNSADRAENQTFLRGLYIQDKLLKKNFNNEAEGALEYIEKSHEYSAKIKNLEEKIKRERQLKLDGFNEVVMLRDDMNKIGGKDREALWKYRYQELLAESEKLKEQNAQLNIHLVTHGGNQVEVVDLNRTVQNLPKIEPKNRRLNTTLI